MTPAPAPVRAVSDAAAANRGIALLRLALVPILVIELPNSRAGLTVDVYPVVVALLAIYATVMLAAGIVPRAPVPAPIVQALIDLVLIAALVYTSGGESSPFRFAFYVLPIIAALRLSPRLTAAWVALALVAFLAVTLRHPATSLPDDLVVLIDEALTLIWIGAAAVMLSALVGRREQRYVELAKSSQRLVQQSLKAEAHERHRLAQVLHDDAIQNLLLARQEVTDLERGVPGSAERAHRALDATHDQLRDEVFAMHPVGLERAGLAAVLRQLGDQAGRRGHFDVDVDVDDAASEVRSDLVYWVVRELLANAAQHAGASRVHVTARKDAGALRLTVDDDGVGFPPERLEQALTDGHIGLASVTERIRSVGGQIAITGVDGQGTTVTATIPTNEPRPSRARTAA